MIERPGVLSVDLDCKECRGTGRNGAGLCRCVHVRPVYSDPMGTVIGGPLTDDAREDGGSDGE